MNVHELGASTRNRNLNWLLGDAGIGGSIGPRHRNPETYFRSGVDLLERDARTALSVLALAHELSPHEPRYASYLGLAMVLTRNQGKKGLKLCEQAAEDGFYDPDIFLNLGRAYIQSGRRKKAWRAFHLGLRVDNRNPSLLAAVAAMGVRRDPVFSVFPRNHAVNRFAGRMLARLRLR